MGNIKFKVKSITAKYLLGDPNSVNWEEGTVVSDEDIVNKKISATKIRLLLEYDLMEVVGNKLNPEEIVSKIMSRKATKRFEDNKYRLNIMKKRGTYNIKKSMIILYNRLTSKSIKTKNIIDFYHLWLSCFGAALWGEKLSKTPYFVELRRKYKPEELGKAWDELFEKMTKYEKIEFNTYGGVEFDKFYTRFKRYYCQLKKQNWSIQKIQ